MQPVAIEQTGQVADHAEPARAEQRVPVAARVEMRGEDRQPRLGQAAVDHLEQRPHHPLRDPRVGLPLGQPPFHAPRRHANDIGREGILLGLGQEPA